MADRWSNPSGSRFRIWPSGTDSYDHSELTNNWDDLDAIIGIPTGGGWPATEGIGGGIYYEIQKAKEAAVPLGVALPWFRANEDMEVPDGYVLAIGQTLTVEEHDIPNVPGTYTVPDMRNKMVIGAVDSKQVGDAGVEVDNSLINIATGGPGPQGTGGENTTTLTKAQMAGHKHTGSTTGWSPILWTWFYDDVTGPYAIKYGQSGNYNVVRNGATNCTTSTGDGGMQFGQHQHAITLAEEGQGKPHENRSRWIGLVWIVKVKNVA